MLSADRTSLSTTSSSATRMATCSGLLGVATVVLGRSAGQCRTGRGGGSEVRDRKGLGLCGAGQDGVWGAGQDGMGVACCRTGQDGGSVVQDRTG
ncbi:hypothetical protein E2C01_004821 [Portunus trituberculatus]|uniref:Uncharacterized protein n=1 Tax=Portunus trituberculatus TaxID=210409 RepID=A0A5B7CXG9_PORTR|nr:hypothetical protein [Portunus trituberculatus]